MLNKKAMTIVEIIISVAIAIVVTILIYALRNSSTKNPPFDHHISDNHKIDCSANATNRKFCKDIGGSN